MTKHDDGKTPSQPDEQALILHLDHGNYKSGHSLPIRLYNTENDLAKFSKVKATHGFHALPLCERRHFRGFNKTEKPVMIQWKGPMYVNSGDSADPLPFPGPFVPSSILTQDNVNSYLLPYLIVCLAVVALIIMAIRGQKDRISKRLSV